MTAERIEMIRQRLTEALHPDQLDIVDESHLHAGHAGAKESGGGHFNVTITSNSFVGKSPIQCHRMVYDALGDAMQTDIHALSIKASAP